MAHWSWARVIAWMIPIGFEVYLEIMGIINPKYPTLSGMIRNTIPVWIRAVIIGALAGWCYYHFVIIAKNPPNTPLMP